MRRFLEEVMSNTADLILMFSDWLVETMAPLLDPVEDFLTNAFQDVFSLTRLIILVIILIGVMW